MDAEALPRHRWYFFKEGFSPAIVDHAIAEAQLPKNAVVFDPFSGSGTTPLTAAQAGYRGRGNEVNPFLRFVASTKAQLGSGGEFTSKLGAVIKAAKQGQPSPLEEFSTFSELAPKAQSRKKWLFNSRVLRAFQGGWASLEGQNHAEDDLIRLCLIGAALDSANAVKDGKCLRYRNGWVDMELGPNEFLLALENRAVAILEDIQLAGQDNLDVTIELGDSRTKPASAKFDLCVTSPPYLNSFDYTDVYRPELFLGGFVKDMAGLRQLRLATIRSHVQASWEAPTTSDFGSNYSDVIKRLNGLPVDSEGIERQLWDPRLPAMIQAYFEDMQRVLVSLRKQAKPSASVWLVVSTSAYAGVEIPVDLIIAEIAGRSGWLLREVSVLRYLRRLAGQQWEELSAREGVSRPHLRESLVILDADRV
jgi:DNA modification methylase